MSQWTPVYEAVSEEALIDNILVLVERDFKKALDYFYPTERLDDFKERALGQVLGNEVPMLGIAPIRNASTSSDDASYLTEILRVDLGVGVTADGPDTVTRKIEQYMRVLEAVLRRGNKNDFFGTLNAARTFGFLLDCEHVYAPDIRANKSILFRDATLQLTVNIHER